MGSTGKAIIHTVLQNLSSHSPFLIIGAPGTGKSTILKELHACTATSKLLSGEQMISDFIKALQANTLSSWRNALYDTDALLIDDLQALSGKVATQADIMQILKAFPKPVVLTLQDGDASFSPQMTAYLDSCTKLCLCEPTGGELSALFDNYCSACSVTMNSQVKRAAHNLIASGAFHNYYQIAGFAKTISLYQKIAPLNSKYHGGSRYVSL